MLRIKYDWSTLNNDSSAPTMVHEALSSHIDSKALFLLERSNLVRNILTGISTATLTVKTPLKVSMRGSKKFKALFESQKLCFKIKLKRKDVSEGLR